MAQDQASSKAPWRPASGYATGSGLARWGLVRDRDGEAPEELRTAAGKVALYLTADAARRKADRLNAGDRPDFDKLPKRVRQVIEICRKGKTLCRGYKPRAIGEEANVVTFWFEPGGRPAPIASSSEAIRKGYLRPLDAGLFGDGNAQSYEAVPSHG